MAGRRTTLPAAPQIPVFRPPCVRCGEPSICWIRGGNVCNEHYVEMFRIEGARHAEENNLRTPEDKIRYIREMLARPKDPRAWMKNPKSQRAAEMAPEVRGEKSGVQIETDLIAMKEKMAAFSREPGSDDE